MAQEDLARAKAFFSDFTAALTSAFPGGIYAIYVGGSFARGDFRIGRSDLDLRIQVMREEEVLPIGELAESLFWGLDARHGMHLRGVYAAKGFFRRREEAGDSRRPFIIQHYGSRKGAIQAPLPPHLSPFKLMFLREMRRHSMRWGRALYLSPEARKEKPRELRETVLDRVFTYSLAVSAAMLPLALIEPGKALERSARAVLFTYDDEPGLFGTPPNRQIPSATRPRLRLRIAREALYIKTHGAGHMCRAGRLAFCIAAPFAIGYKNIADALARPAGSNGR